MMLPPEIVELIPPAARYQPVPLSDADNAYGLWEEAAENYVNFDDLKLSPYFWSDTKTFPRGELGREVKAWLDANRDVIELYRAGARRRGWQLPECEKEKGHFDLDRMQRMRPMGWLLQSHVRRCLAEGQIDDAVQTAIDLMRAGRLLCCGNSGTVGHSFGSAMTSIGRECAREAALHRSTTPAQLTSLVAAVDELLATDDGFVNSCRRDLVNQLRDVLEFPESGDAELLTNHMLEKLYAHDVAWGDVRAERERIREAVQADGRLNQRDSDIRFVLSGHLAPFDRAATIKLIAAEVNNVVEKYPLGWHALVDGESVASNPLEGLWPFQLYPSFPVKCLGNSQQAREAWEAFDRDWYGCEAVYPSQEELESLRDRLRSVPNPIGWLRWADGHGISLRHFSFRSRAQLLLLRVVLALCVYRLQYGKLPAELSTLVAEGLLREIPIDPFDGQPVRYSRRRQIVWSVGEDGVDDGGEPSEWGEVYSTKDIVMSARLDSRWHAWRDYWIQWRAMRQPYEDADETIRRIYGD